MAADQKDTTVTEESNQEETVATKAKPASASKKLCAEELIREFEALSKKMIFQRSMSETQFV
jgi:large subunit ribosomal protein L19